MMSIRALASSPSDSPANQVTTEASPYNDTRMAIRMMRLSWLDWDDISALQLLSNPGPVGANPEDENHVDEQDKAERDTAADLYPAGEAGIFGWRGLILRFPVR